MKRKVSTREIAGNFDLQYTIIDDVGKPFGLVRNEEHGKWILLACSDTTDVEWFEAPLKVGAVFRPNGEVFVGGQKVRQSDAVEARRHQEKMANELA